MRIRVGLLALGALAVILLDGAWPPPALAAPQARHSGVVVSVDPKTGMLVLEELTVRFDPKKGAVEMKRRLELRVTLLTTLVLSERLPDDQVKDLRRPFTETPISLSGIWPGDFVVVKLAEKGENVATSVTVTFRSGSR
ncbi:MAG: hypothetical protein ACE5JN_14360 [Candidatus Methylomirabilia bacterium]